MPLDRACRRRADESSILLSENRREICISNQSRAMHDVWRVDGCLRLNIISCDYVVVKPDVGVIYVELKGTDVPRAIDQLKATWEAHKGDFLPAPPVGFVIVCRQYPRFSDALRRFISWASRIGGAKVHLFTRRESKTIEQLLN